MLGEHGNDDRRIFRALALMDRRGIGGDQHVEFTESVSHGSAVEVGGKFACIGIYVCDVTDVAVVDLLVVVVLDLHDLVARREGPAEVLPLPLAGGDRARPEVRRSTTAPRWHPGSWGKAPARRGSGPGRNVGGCASSPARRCVLQRPRGRPPARSRSRLLPRVYRVRASGPG